MDSLITAAARALAMGDPLGALNRVALRDDTPALALRGIAMAQLGDLNRAKALVRRAGRALGPREAVGPARSGVADGPVAPPSPGPPSAPQTHPPAPSPPPSPAAPAHAPPPRSPRAP